MLYSSIDAYIARHTEPLQRLRLARYQQTHEPGDAQNQLSLPINDPQDGVLNSCVAVNIDALKA